MITKKINNVSNVHNINNDKRPILHNNICNIKYPIICVCGKKGSGKSSTLLTILKESINVKNPGCSIHIFSWTIETDPIIKEIEKEYEEHKYISVYKYDDIFEGKRNILLDLLNTIIQNKKDEENEDYNINKEPEIKWKYEKEHKEPRLKKYSELNYICAHHIIIIDDMTHI